MSDAELLAPVTPQEQAPPPEPPPEEPQAAAPVSEDADLDKMIAEQAIDIPGDTDKLVPLAAVENARAKLKTVRAELETAKAGSAEAATLKGQIEQLQQQLNAALPLAQAYQAALQAQPPADTPKGPTPEERAELEEIARDNDYYKTDGALDLDRAQRAQARIYKAAEKIAGAAVAPLQQQSIADRSAIMLRNAKLTASPDGFMPDPAIVDALWAQLDPKLTATREGALQVWRVAMGDSAALGKLVKKQAQAAAREPLPPVILTEKSGGKEHSAPTLTDDDRRAARQMGISDKDYAEELAKMPAGWGKR